MTRATSQQKVVVALSGGIDSAVAALLLLERGVSVVGVTLRLMAGRTGDAVPAPEAIERARSVSRQLGIPFHVADAQEPFASHVVDYFIAGYAAGRTPNPCVRCNRFVRFSLLMQQAKALDADGMATGHYARIRQNGSRYQLLRGSDEHKDQSYFLHALTQEQLACTDFPLGHLTKDEVRHMASRHNLTVARQGESQDVCFMVAGDYRQFLEERAPDVMEPGPIRDTSGHLLGEHGGLAAYTIGQRKGLGISAPEPLYVLAMQPEENTLIVGTADELGQDECLVEELHYVRGDIPCHPFRAEAQIRYRARPALVFVNPLSDYRAEVRFDASQRDITPGQFLVLYHGEVVLGGGIICESKRAML
ncbi:MAG: tRNA 2-thiouridine(34) synthase MnmA [Anaerolineae bacterium]